MLDLDVLDLDRVKFSTEKIHLDKFSKKYLLFCFLSLTFLFSLFLHITTNYQRIYLTNLKRKFIETNSLKRNHRDKFFEDKFYWYKVSEEKLLDTLRATYADKPFIRVVDHLPATKDVSGTNFCDITARVVRDRVITISCIDNLIKGASGAAVQNFNWMYNFAETTAF